jgi:hypothetical protein
LQCVPNIFNWGHGDEGSCPAFRRAPAADVAVARLQTARHMAGCLLNLSSEFLSCSLLVIRATNLNIGCPRVAQKLMKASRSQYRVSTSEHWTFHHLTFVFSRNPQYTEDPRAISLVVEQRSPKPPVGVRFLHRPQIFLAILALAY